MIELITALAIVCSMVAPQASKTLREMVREQGPVNVYTQEDFPPITLREVLAKVDVVFRGTVIGAEGSYVSEDGLDVLTEYSVDGSPVMVHDRVNGGPGEDRPRAIIVVQRGGTTLIDGQQVTVTHGGLEPLRPGTEAVFMLHRDGDTEKYRLVMDYFGVFTIDNGVVIPPRKGGMSRAYKGRTVDEFMSELATAASIPHH